MTLGSRDACPKCGRLTSFRYDWTSLDTYVTPLLIFREHSNPTTHESCPVQTVRRNGETGMLTPVVPDGRSYE